MTTRLRKRAQVWGVMAEYLCMAFLLLKGYTLLKSRHRNRGGEIDIIASHGMLLTFIEVKARAHVSDALASVTADKRRRIFRAAETFMAANPRYAQHDLRFDVMVITSMWKIHHLQNAWRSE